MRVLFAYNKHRGNFGGGDSAAWLTAQTLRRHGLDVEVFTRSSDDLPRNLLGRVEAGLSVLYAPTSVRRVRELIDSFRPDVLHIYEVFPLVSPWIIPECTRRGIPVVSTCIDYRLTCPVVTHFYRGQICDRCSTRGEHWALLRNCRGNLAESLMVTVYNKMNRHLGLFSEHVSTFIAPSEFTRSWLIGHAGLDPSRVTVVDPIVEVPEIAAEPGEGAYVGFAGRLTVEKGVLPFLEASRICGVPFKMAVHENSRTTMDVPPDADIVITRSPEDLDAFYRGARVMVFPSVWFETFGLVGAEAMARGIPVVASKIGALGCLIEDGVDGLHFEPGNAADLADKVMRLWRDPELCRRLGEAGRRKAIRNWNPARHVERTKALYQSALAGKEELSLK
jgi:glycosyltransferase involved in cell wall biosynthesis